MTQDSANSTADSDAEPGTQSQAQSSAQKRPSSLLVTLPLLAIMFGAFIYAGLGFIGYQEAQIPEKWLNTGGQIVETGIEVISHEQQNGQSVETYQPKVRYRYEVGGSFLIGTQLSRNHQERTIRGVAETEIEDLRQGAMVTVHYNPDNPQESVLRKSDTIGPMQAISAGLAIGMTTTALFLITLLRRRIGAS